MGNPETGVKWNLNENEVGKGGIYEQPKFAVIVRHTQHKYFTMSLFGEKEEELNIELVAFDGYCLPVGTVKVKAATFGRYFLSSCSSLNLYTLISSGELTSCIKTTNRRLASDGQRRISNILQAI